MLAKLLIISFSIIILHVSRPNSVKCEVDITERIVGGQETDIKVYPYQVGVNFPYADIPDLWHTCGGCLISGDVVLTAAHCTEYSVEERSNGQVHAGSTDKWDGGQFISIIQIVDHPSYNPDRNDFDLAILKLESTLEAGPTIQTIPIATYARKNGVLATVTGWGRTISGNDTSSSQILKAVTIPFWNSTYCRTKSLYKNKITINMVCAGYFSRDGSNTCQGDSGGPLVNNGELIAVVSWGEANCATKGYPGVFVDVYRFRKWILNIRNKLGSS